MTRKTHLSHTTLGGPTCQRGRRGGALRGEHCSESFAEFITRRADLQCDRCRSSKLFAFLERKASDQWAPSPDAWVPEAPNAWIAADAALIAKHRRLAA
jgi:hypothetical protein